VIRLEKKEKKYNVTWFNRKLLMKDKKMERICRSHNGQFNDKKRKEKKRNKLNKNFSEYYDLLLIY